MSRRILALGLVILTAAGCSWKDRFKTFFQGEERKAAVRVGDKIYARPELDRFFDDRLSEFRDPANNDILKSNLLDSFIEEKLLLTEAERHKVEPDARTLKTMMEKMSEMDRERQGGRTDPSRIVELERSISDSLKMQQYLHDYLLKGIAVSDSECEAYYKEHLAEYVRNDAVRVREILVGDMAKAQELLASLKTRRNRNFADLARVHSKGASAAEGGDLGTFQKGELPEDFEKVIFRLTPGNVSKVVSSRYGYHIFLVEERVPAHQQKLPEVRDQIRGKLALDRERDIINKELTALMSRIGVEVFRDRLDFDYVGTRFSARQGRK